MVLRIIAVLETDAATDPTHDDKQLQVDRGPVVSRPVELIGRGDENFNFSGHHSIALDRETRSVGVGVLDRCIPHPLDTRWFAFQLQSLTLNLGQRLVTVQVDSIVDAIEHKVVEDLSISPSLVENGKKVIDPLNVLSIVHIHRR